MKKFAYWIVVALALCSCGQRKSEGRSVEDSIVFIVISEQERAEYEREAASWLAQFDTNAVPEVERRAIVRDYYAHVLDDEERGYFDSGDLDIEVGVFSGTGIRAVRINHPMDFGRRVYFNGMQRMAIYADRYAMSKDSLFVAEHWNNETGMDNLEVWHIDGYNLSKLSLGRQSALRYKEPFYPDGWGRGGMMYYSNDSGRYRLQVSVEGLRRNTCRVEDREITREEFMAAQAEMAKYNYAERERAWMAEDSALVRAESSESHLSIDELMDEAWLGEWPEAGVRSLVLSAGDACCTLIHGDTVCVETCSLVLSHDKVLAGIWKEWGAGDDELPAYLCFHRIGGGPQQEWQTTPAWTPSGRPGFFFWGADGWLYVEGNLPNTEHDVWHKVKVLR